MSSAASRGVFSRMLRGQLDSISAEEVRQADIFVDHSLEHLESEEPSLARWLESDPELVRALKANISAVYQSILNDSAHGRPIDFTLQRINQMIFRIVCAAAWRAALRERSIPQEWKPSSND